MRDKETENGGQSNTLNRRNNDLIDRSIVGDGWLWRQLAPSDPGITRVVKQDVKHTAAFGERHVPLHAGEHSALERDPEDNRADEQIKLLATIAVQTASQTPQQRKQE